MQYNDGFKLNADDCFEEDLVLYKIKNILICCCLNKDSFYNGHFNFRLLKLFVKVSVL